MNFNRREFIRGAAGLAGASMLGTAAWSPAKSYRSNLRLAVEGNLPELKHALVWLNSRPLTADTLRGKVVLINFWTYTCINSLRTLPYLRAWAETYEKQGLVVIGVHTPEFTFEQKIENVRRAARENRVDYPIAIDSKYAIWRAFANQYWPALYFVDGKGRIRHHQFGEGNYQKSERVIQELLDEAGSDVGSEPVQVNPQGVEAGPDWRNLHSPETYTGTELSRNFAGVRKGSAYHYPARLPLNHWALDGNWIIGKEAAVLKRAQGRAAYRFHARDLHLIVTPPASGHQVRFRVLLDGQTPEDAHGVDTDGGGYGTVTEARLYQLIRQTQPVTDRQFEIEFEDPGVQVFDFTFG